MFGLSLSVTPLTNKGPVLKDSVPVLNVVIIEAETSPNNLIWSKFNYALVFPDRCVSKPVFHYFSGNFFQHCPCVGNFSWWQSRISHIVWLYSWITWRWKIINFFPLCTSVMKTFITALWSSLQIINPWLFTLPCLSGFLDLCRRFLNV